MAMSWSYVGYAIYALDWPKVLLLCASRETGNANSGFLLSTKLIFFGFHITLLASTTKHVLIEFSFFVLLITLLLSATSECEKRPVTVDRHD